MPRAAWRDWYSRADWRRKRAHQLHIEPLCCVCAAQGRTTAATVVDHVEPHGGNLTKFLTGKLVSMCVHCHNAKRGGQLPRVIGLDGLPVDFGGKE
jgi:5-methylcytosine-specific restriction protein A